MEKFDPKLLQVPTGKRTFMLKITLWIVIDSKFFNTKVQDKESAYKCGEWIQIIYYWRLGLNFIAGWGRWDANSYVCIRKRELRDRGWYEYPKILWNVPVRLRYCCVRAHNMLKKLQVLRCTIEKGASWNCQNFKCIFLRTLFEG